MIRGRLLAVVAVATATVALVSPVAVGARSDAPLRVLVVGESEAATLAAGVPADTGVHGLRARPDLDITDRTILACSISSVHAFVIDGQPADNLCGGTGKWQQQWAADVRALRPDVVLVMAGARDVFDVAGTDGTAIHPGDAGWTSAYRADVAQLFEILHATGAPVVAVEPPCFGENTMPGGDPEPRERLDPVKVRAVQSVWRAAATRAPGVQLLDLTRTLCPDGQNDPSIRPDGVHFVGAGADRLASRVTTALRRAYARRARR